MSKSSRKQKTAPPATLSRTDKTLLVGIPLMLFAGLALLFHFVCVGRQTDRITSTVNEWTRLYSLSDEHVKRIIQIELDYHGNGSPFSIQQNHPPGAKHRHHEEISHLMSPDDGARFMERMEKSGAAH